LSGIGFVRDTEVMWTVTENSLLNLIAVQQLSCSVSVRSCVCSAETFPKAGHPGALCSPEFNCTSDYYTEESAGI